MSARIQTPPTPRKPYSTPRFISYGEVRTLTQGGTQGLTEANTMQGMKMPSDRLVKESVVGIGRHPLGIGLYLFDYRPEFRARYGYGRQFGVMADEAEKVMPHAVSVNAFGHKVVDYAMLGIWPSNR